MIPVPVAPDSMGSVHEPEKKDKRKKRRKLFFFDRVKVLILLAVVLGYGVALKKSAVPIMSWSDAIRDQVSAKWWVFVIAAVELVRQIHNFISERSAAYNTFWVDRVWGGWDRFWGRRNPWLRFRLARIVRIAIWIALAMVVFSWLWGVSFIEAFAQAPRNLLYSPFGANGLPFFFQIFMSLGFGILQFVGIFWFLSRGGVDTYNADEIDTRFADVWGQDKVLGKIQENIVFLDKPEEIESKGGHVPSGILLYGPPGTGKTLIAEAVAGETGKPFVFVDPGAFIQMFVGVGILKVKSLFRKLRKLALKHGGVIVFFDEADTLGSRGGAVQDGGYNLAGHAAHDTCNGAHYLSEAGLRLLQGIGGSPAAPMDDDGDRPRRWFDGIRGVMVGNFGGGGMGTVQALLTELSGLKKPRGGVSRRLRQFLNMPAKKPPKYRILVMMATNMPDALDPALRRPGRIDRSYHVDFPNLEGRIRTFEGYFNKVRHQVTPAEIRRLATITRRGTGAVIKDVVNESLIVASRKGRDFVTWPDVLEARTFKLYGLSEGPAATMLERWETSLHEASHAVAMFRLRKRDEIDIATIEQRGAVGGFVAPVPIEERKFSWKSDIETDLVTFVVSLAGERHFFGGNNSVGVGGDLSASTSMVRAMILRAGMEGTLTSGEGSGPANADTLDARVEAKLQDLYAQAQQLVRDNEALILAVAHALMVRHTISGEDIAGIANNTAGPIVDGRWYYERGNMQLVREFHARALRAHQDETIGFDGDLPPLPDMPTMSPPPASFNGFPPPLGAPIG